MSERSSILRCPACGKANRVRAVAPGVPHCAHCGEPLPWLVDIEEPAFHTAVEESPIPVLAEFWAPWCGPCSMVAPVVAQLSREQAGRLKVVKVNVDDAPGLSRRFDVRGIPALLLFEGGELRDRLTGAVDTAALRRWLERSRV
jgi:thioredoxin 2